MRARCHRLDSGSRGQTFGLQIFSFIVICLKKYGYVFIGWKTISVTFTPTSVYPLSQAQRPRPFRQKLEDRQVTTWTDWLTCRKVTLLFSWSNHFFFRTFELKTANSLANHDCCVEQTSCLSPTKTTTCLPQTEYKMLFLRWSVSICVVPWTVPPTS